MQDTMDDECDKKNVKHKPQIMLQLEVEISDNFSFKPHFPIILMRNAEWYKKKPKNNT